MSLCCVVLFVCFVFLFFVLLKVLLLFFNFVLFTRQISDELKESMQDKMKQYGFDTDVTNSFDKLQEEVIFKALHVSVVKLDIHILLFHYHSYRRVRMYQDCKYLTIIFTKVELNNRNIHCYSPTPRGIP